MKWTDPFKKFIIDLYLKSYNDPGNTLIKKIRPAVLTSYRNTSQQTKDSINRLLKKALNNIDASVLTELLTYDSVIGLGRNYQGMLPVIQTSWFKQWFWMQGGNLKLNPLKFTNKNYLEKTVTTDKVKAAIFDRYIDSVIEKRTRFDTMGHPDEFKKLDDLKGTGEDIYTVSNEDKITSENTASMNDLLSVTQTINVIQIPVDDNDKTPNHIPFSTGKRLADPNQKQKGTEPLLVNDAKIVVLHNIPSGWKLYLKETDSKLKVQSIYAEILDSTVDLKKILAATSVTINPLFAALNAVTPDRYPKLQRGNVQYDMTMENVADDGVTPIDHGPTLFFTDETFRVIAEKATKKNNTYFKPVFDSLMRIAPFNGVSNTRVSDLTDTNRKILYNQFIKDYKASFDKTANIALENIRDDSTVYAHLNIVWRSTVPPKLPVIEESKDFKYSSKFDTTKVSISPIEKNVQVMIYKGKDSTTITDFNYQIDKGKRVQMSAGIVYTIAGLHQTKVDEMNGEIKVSSKSEQFRMVAGINVYFKDGLFLEDKRWGGQFSQRVSLFAGVGIPDPLGNFYLAPSYDLVPGVRLMSGVHLYRYTKYSFLNNTISAKQNIYKLAGPFVSIAIDPVGFINALNLF